MENEIKESQMVVDVQSLVDSMLCESGSRFIPYGFTIPDCKDEVVMFVNAGGEALNQDTSTVKISGDACFEGGSVLRTNELITDPGDYPFIYQSARFGNFCYRLCDLPPGNYFVDLHFAEIINTHGPTGIRVFDVYMQEEKVLSEFDIFAVVGANKPLQVVNSMVSVKQDGILIIKFEGVNGSPAVCGICVRKAPELKVPETCREYLKCEQCSAEIEISSAQKRHMRTKATDKFEKKIQELTLQCRHKADECHEAWLSLTSANEQLEKVRMELDNKTFQARCLEQTVGKEAENLRIITSKYECDKKYWAEAVQNLQAKIKQMKEEHSQLTCEAHACANAIPELNKMLEGVQSLVTQCEDLKFKYSQEQAKRKELFNQLQDTKGNIRVFCRCRPLSKDEISTGCATIVDFEAAKDGDLGILTGGSTKKAFKFDRIYTPKDNQERSDTFTYDISVSVLEVYNEQIRDLLATSSSSKKLEIKQTAEGAHHVPGIVEAKVDNIKEVWSVLQVGSNARAVGSNNVNEHSSRSHCMLCVMVKAKNLMNGGCTKSKLWLVDLAGSERLAKTDVQGERLKEAQNINRSLSALGDVIHSLANKSSHVPYRNSKLTHLLQDSLGKYKCSLSGDSKTLMFVQISPSEKDVSETLSSLNFATRVRGVELGPIKRQVDTSELQKLKLMLEKARQDAKSKDESLKKLEENLQNLESKAKGKDNIHKTQLEKIRELENQLEVKASMQNQTEKQIAQLSDRLKGKEENYSGLQQKVKDLETKLREKQLSESSALQQMVNDLESKLKEQIQESESHSLLLQHKIKELEKKLTEQEQQQLETSSLRQKIMELEDKLREKEQQLELTRDFAAAVRDTPSGPKTCMRDDELMSDVDCLSKKSDKDFEPRILRSSNSINRPMSHGSALPKGNSYGIQGVVKKRQSRSGETENCNVVPTAMGGGDKRARKSDPPKITRPIRVAVKPVVISTSKGPSTSSTQKRSTNRDQVLGIRERDAKKRIWN
ncbi:hypothetical protein ACFE04_018316 [Oxalis oulophora]